MTDAVTGLTNHTGLLIATQTLIDGGQTSGAPFALAYFGADSYGSLTDPNGYASDDHVLVVVADIIIRNIRADDRAGRIGAETFAVLIPDCDETEAYGVATRVLSSLNREIAMQRLPVGFWVGIACFPTPPADAQAAFVAAAGAVREARDLRTIHLTTVTRKPPGGD